ncbi:MAG: hypothetical protein J07HX64_00898 [halophilic archaeon J07HX64]|nr:MAG: hypothetical protein J07HX64_00898 [halophilic archaeon J07HX64]
MTVPGVDGRPIDETEIIVPVSVVSATAGLTRRACRQADTPSRVLLTD